MLYVFNQYCTVYAIKDFLKLYQCNLGIIPEFMDYFINYPGMNCNCNF